MSDEITAMLHAGMPLTRTMGMAGVESTPERVVVDLEWSEHLLTTGGQLHGGALMALADSAGAGCAFMNLPDGASGTSTIESKTNFLGPVREGHAVRATAVPLHVGGTTIVVETELRVGERLVAKVTQTQAVLRPSG
ncbi:MAG: PaaI family thioesterase [Ilumatobacter sp.]|nr:PaaI family thioesterase [Ilumatobacter sp.]MDJ0767945.1 PaaI family thioesterase [Ilumatobacter sp.]